jgi:hypothetical protein
MLKRSAVGSVPADTIPKTDRKTAMNKAEPLCDLRFLAAEYQRAKATDRVSDSSFNLTFRPLGAAPTSFTVAGKDGVQFAAELDVLAALIRARVIRARVDGEEKPQ